MKFSILVFGFAAFISISLFGQSLNEAGYPVYSPFADTDVYDEENSYPFYYQDPAFADTSVHQSGYRGTYQYAFNPGRNENDGNSTLNIYFSEFHDDISFPNGKPLVVILHGRKGDNTSTKNNKMASAFARRGYVAIVPDYTTEGDSLKWGDIPYECRSRSEFLYTINYAVRDVRAAIRFTLAGADLMSSNIDIDENSIHVLGFSFGAITASYLSYAQANDYPIGTEVTIHNEDYTFTEDLDDVWICPNPEFPCGQAYSSASGYDLKGSIKTSVLVAPMTLGLNIIDNTDEVQALLFHGTCDNIVPIDAPTVAQQNYRKQLASGNVPNALTCNTESSGHRLYGSSLMYRKIRSLPTSPTGFDPDPGLFILCGAGHGLSNDYFDIEEDAEIKSIGFYETLRFFSNSLNGNSDGQFFYTLDHSLTENYNPEEETIKCSAMPINGWNSDPFKGSPIVYNALRRKFCLSCSGQGPQPILRNPNYNAENVDFNRYDFLDFPNCGDEINDPQNLNKPLYSIYGEFITNVKWNPETDEVQFPADSNFEKGFYYILAPDGAKKTVVVE